MTSKRNEAAAALASLRWAGTSPDERRAMVGDIASSGGKAAWAKLTPAQRSKEMKRRARRRKGSR